MSQAILEERTKYRAALITIRDMLRPLVAGEEQPVPVETAYFIARDAIEEDDSPYR